MTITLPDELRDELERKAHTAGFPTVDEYVCWRLQEPDEADVEFTPQDLGHESQEALEAHLLKALESPAITVGPGFWDDLRRRSIARAEELKGRQ